MLLAVAQIRFAESKKKLSTYAGSSTNLKANLLRRTSEVTQPDKMKYSQACLLKKQVEASIEKLMATVVGQGATDAVRTRLEVAHVSHIVNWKSHMLIDDDSKILMNWKVDQLPWFGIGM